MITISALISATSITSAAEPPATQPADAQQNQTADWPGKQPDIEKAIMVDLARLRSVAMKDELESGWVWRQFSNIRAQNLGVALEILKDPGIRANSPLRWSAMQLIGEYRPDQPRVIDVVLDQIVSFRIFQQIDDPAYGYVGIEAVAKIGTPACREILRRRLEREQEPLVLFAFGRVLAMVEPDQELLLAQLRVYQKHGAGKQNPVYERQITWMIEHVEGKKHTWHEHVLEEQERWKKAHPNGIAR